MRQPLLPPTLLLDHWDNNLRMLKWELRFENKWGHLFNVNNSAYLNEILIIKYIKSNEHLMQISGFN